MLAFSMPRLTFARHEYDTFSVDEQRVLIIRYGRLTCNAPHTVAWLKKMVAGVRRHRQRYKEGSSDSKSSQSHNDDL